jgi:hypothetical protein
MTADVVLRARSCGQALGDRADHAQQQRSDAQAHGDSGDRDASLGDAPPDERQRHDQEDQRHTPGGNELSDCDLGGRQQRRLQDGQHTAFAVAVDRLCRQCGHDQQREPQHEQHQAAEHVGAWFRLAGLQEGPPQHHGEREQRREPGSEQPAPPAGPKTQPELV